MSKSSNVYQEALAAFKPFLGEEKAKTYALFAQHVYDNVQEDPDVQSALAGYKNWKDGKDVIEGFQKIEKANEYLSKVVPQATAGFRDYRAYGAASILNVFVDRFEKVAQHRGIELNQCWLMVSKVSLDIGTTGVGAVSSLTPFGWAMLGWGAISTFKDSYALGTACFISPDSGSKGGK
jgi:hypothetical protein